METQYEIELGGRPLVIATGRFAQQAGGAVTVRYGDTLLLGTATASSPRPGIDFFPLSVEFEERLYAAGRIPGSFFRREGRPTTGAILSARLTDRPLRPLFPAGYNDDTQIILTILSADMENPPDTLGTIAASTALTISDIPFDGPVASVRVGCIDGKLVLQPTFPQFEESTLNLVVSGTRDAIMMVEANANEVPESLLVEAIELGQEAITSIVAVQDQMRAEHGKPKREYSPSEVPADIVAQVRAAVGDKLDAAFSAGASLTKAERDERRDALRQRVLDTVDAETDVRACKAAFEELERTILRRNILEQGARPDGRSPTEIRPLSAEVALIPRTHGSGLFQRGETQVLSLTTLAGTGMMQRLDELTPGDSKRFMHHYNFPPFTVGETGRVGGPGRREVGHGMLAERAVAAMLPPFEEFPYTIRIVSEVLSSNGSTSMASVCASTLSLMDAGVPLRAPVAGIAMGLIKGAGPEQFQVLTDIAGLEDHFGDMDFKVAGTQAGVTALQMDIKVKGITPALMDQALVQARDARLEILETMKAAIASPRDEMSPYAPRMERIEVPTEKIGMIIGPAGKTIRALEADTGASINIEDDGSVYVSAVSGESLNKALDAIRGLVKDVEIGEIYTGKVVRILDFGAFVEILPGKDALVHISELENYRVGKVEDVLKVGDEVKVRVQEIDNLGRINASRRVLLKPDGGGDGREGSSGGGRGSGGGGGGGRPAGPRDGGGRERESTPPVAERAERAERPERPERPRSERPPTSETSDDPPGGDGARRRRRRRRRPAGERPAGERPTGGPTGERTERTEHTERTERPERQPDSPAGKRNLTRGIFGQARSSDEPPAPPPPPRRDFGAPGTS